MAFCPKCGAQVEDGTAFCPVCGAEVSNAEPAVEVKPEPKVWQTFAKLGFIFGLIGFIGSFIPFLNYATIELAVVGIVFSALGKKSTIFFDKANKGLKFAIAGTIISVVMIFFVEIILLLVAGDAIDYSL